MVAVAIGWQIYDLARETRGIEESALLLGIVGLVQFVPILLLSLFAGQVADRHDRRWVLLLVNVLRLLVLSGLFAACYAPSEHAILLIFLMAAAMGAVNAFTPAAANALFPLLVPREQLPTAIAWNSLGFQAASIFGPAFVGLLYLAGAQVVYGSAAVVSLIALVNFWLINAPQQEPIEGDSRRAMIIDGLRYVLNNRIVLGAISLDLVVVFFGGVTALLPVFARDILHVGSEGLGILRASPALGAALVGLFLASRGIRSKVGMWMLGAIVVYGLATYGFAFSNLLWLSCLMLAITGAADMISVYVRSSLIQLATPDAMRGRVSSVAFIFIAASNELGEFESGVAARFLGPVGAVVLGGSVALCSVGLWLKAFPQLARADRFDDVESLAASRK